jgi:hypothetical protein
MELSKLKKLNLVPHGKRETECRKNSINPPIDREILGFQESH